MPVSTAIETRKLFSYKIIININLLSDQISWSSFAMKAQVLHADKTTHKIIVHISQSLNLVVVPEKDKRGEMRQNRREGGEERGKN